MPFAVPSSPSRARLAGLAALAVLAGAVSAGMAGPAQADPTKAAIFPIELLDPGVVGGSRARPVETR